ncbi:MAG: Rossmann-like and DUF2520 domain-containing protein [Thermoleophilaceae bacterium]
MDRGPPAPSPRQIIQMTPDTESNAGPARIGVVGPGRLGTAMAAALRQAGYQVDGPAGRGEQPSGEAILLCVPDAEIESAATAIAGAAQFVGHTSGATPLSALRPAQEAGAAAFGLHPLQTFPEAPEDAAALFKGAGCAIAGASQEAVATARTLAESLGMSPFELDDADRPAYHAAASMASNFLVTLEAAAERLAEGAGLEPSRSRRLLAPLVRRTVENWAATGPEAALTGPVARGDVATVEAQREAVAAEAPELLALFDELVERTRALARPEVTA